VATYAFVNPVVALFLGWLLLGETITLRTVIAAAVILTAVILVITAPASDPCASQGSGSCPWGSLIVPPFRWILPSSLCRTIADRFPFQAALLLAY